MRFAFATTKSSAGGISVRRAILLAVLFASVSNTAAAFNIYTVGSDAACAFTKIQDAVNAAAGHAGKDDVWIANNATYDNVQINVANQDVNIQGGFTSCSDQTITTNDQTTLHGGTSGPIFSITGTSNVYIGNLVITGAQRGSQAEGGGIVFTGSGSLMLQATTVSQNHAGYGAGIDISPSGNGATVTLMNDNIIDFNTAAVSGGGIRIEGKTDLIMASDHNLIFQNHALGQGDNGYGGGIEVIGPAHAEIGSPGYGTLPVIDANDAQYGGGIAILATSANNNAFVSMFTTDATRAVQMSNNTASVKGGAAYLHAFSSSASGHSTSSLCAVDYRINANEAPDGAAVYLDWDTSAAGNDVGTSLLLDINDGQCPYSIQTLGAVRCAKGIACNEISDNIGDNSEHALKAGAVVAVGTSSTFQADPVLMRGNSALNLINAVGNNDGNQPPGVTLRDCLIVENQMAQEIISMNGNDAPLIVDNCTIANNTAGGDKDIIYSHDTVTLSNDIFANVNVPVLDYDILAGLSVNYVLANDISTISPAGGIGIVQGAPIFVNESGSDYHLAPKSAGIDFAPPNLGTTSFDLDLNQRNVDLSSVTNIHGPIDLGAYELQTIDVCAESDTIFCNGFESP